MGWAWESTRIEARRGGIGGDGNATATYLWVTSVIPRASPGCRGVVDRRMHLGDVITRNWSRHRGGLTRKGAGPAVDRCRLPILPGERDVGGGLLEGEWQRFPRLARLQESTAPEGCNGCLPMESTEFTILTAGGKSRGLPALTSRAWLVELVGFRGMDSGGEACARDEITNHLENRVFWFLRRNRDVFETALVEWLDVVGLQFPAVNVVIQDGMGFLRMITEDRELLARLGVRGSSIKILLVDIILDGMRFHVIFRDTWLCRMVGWLRVFTRGLADPRQEVPEAKA